LCQSDTTKAKGREEDLADILYIKNRISNARIPDAIVHAKTAIARNPNNPHFYYPIVLAKDSTAGLRAAKRGLRSKKTTPFVRFALLQCAVDRPLCWQCALQATVVGDKKW